MAGEQFQFVFPEPTPSLEALFFGPEGAASIQVLRQWQKWPKRFVALTGPDRSGVSSVLKAWAREVEGLYLRPDDWKGLDVDQLVELLEQPLALDDVEDVKSSNSLLTLLNLAVEQGGAVLLGGHGNPRKWHTNPPDLVSRLSAVTRLVLPLLDDESFDRRLRSACLRRFIDLPPETLKYVRPRLERSYAAIEAFADRLNTVMGSENKSASVPVAKEILSSLNQTDEDQAPES